MNLLFVVIPAEAGIQLLVECSGFRLPPEWRADSSTCRVI